jgi:hypothetical protein
VHIPAPGDVLAAIFTSGPRAEPAGLTIGPCDRMTEPEPGPEAETP